MNRLDDIELSQESFSYRDIIGQDKWTVFTPVFGSLTTVGTPTYTGRMRIIGRSLEFQVKIVPGTTIASVAGSDYMNFPVSAKGLSGIAILTNQTTNISVGVCHIDVANSRCWLPTQTASGNTFNLVGSYEV